MAAFTAARSQIKPKVSAGRGRAGYFDFWNMDFGQQFAFRLLPNRTGDTPWIERKTIKLPFDGVIGGDYPTTDAVTVTVQCIEHHGLICPITTMNKPLWKSDVDEARRRWRKLSHLVQGFVVGTNPLPDMVAPESGIWKMELNKSIFEVVEGCANDADLEYAPWDPDEGREVVVSKTKRGEYAAYPTRLSSKARSLSEAERAAAEKYGLFELRDELGPVPDAAAIDIIRQLGEASFAGEPFDADKFHGYRAWKANDYGASSVVTPTAGTATRTDNVLAQLAMKNRSLTAGAQ